jgi:chromosome segregation ATPase
MNDNDKLDELIQNTPKWTTEHFDHLKKIKAALNAERDEHAKEVADLKKKDVCVNCEGLLMTIKVSQQKYDQHIENLQQRIKELEEELKVQKPLIYVLKEE